GHTWAGSMSTTPRLETLAEAGRELARAESLDEALPALARATAAATGATLAVVRVPDGRGGLPARGVWSDSSALSAELEGSRLLQEELAAEELSEADELPAAVKRLAERIRAVGILLMPSLADDEVVASLELMRPREPFTGAERAVAQIAALQAGVPVRPLRPTHRVAERGGA